MLQRFVIREKGRRDQAERHQSSDGSRLQMGAGVRALVPTLERGGRVVDQIHAYVVC